jgi:hypothetical protein
MARRSDTPVDQTEATWSEAAEPARLYDSLGFRARHGIPGCKPILELGK